MPCYQNVCYQDVLLPKCLLPKCHITETSYYRNVLLPKCQLPKRPLPKCPLPKCLDTMHTDISEKPFKRDACGNVLQKGGVLYPAIMTLTLVRNFKCSACG